MRTRTLVGLAAACALLAQGARGDSLTEDNAESRFVLALKADVAALQKRLPPELEVAPLAAGPSQGANLLLVFYDRFLQLDGLGKPVPSASQQRMIAVVAVVKARTTGKPAFAVLRVFNSNPDQVPGFYQVGVLATVEREASAKARALEGGQVEEEWKVRTQQGDSIRLKLAYTRSLPARSQREMQIFSAAKGDLFRIYKTDELADVVRSVPANVDRARKLDYRVSIADMSDLFGTGTTLVGAVANPIFLRKVFVPEAHALR